jgi:hypothetical protein
MLAKEKAELLKSTIKELYSNEGRSISYISRLLEIDRHTLSNLIKNNNFLQINQHKGKIRQFLKEYREVIVSKIKNGESVKQICAYCHVGHEFYQKVLEYDTELANTKNEYLKEQFEEYTKMDGEIWKPIVGYENYEVSNFGRIKKRHNIIKPILNTKHDRYYITLWANGKRKNFILARIVAHAFCDGYDENHNTVNHLDGNTHNNSAENLEWVSQSDNNLHSYKVLKRKVNIRKPIKYIIVYKGTYRFKTISAFSRFLNLSETQTRRWLDEPEKHEIQKVYK